MAEQEVAWICDRDVRNYPIKNGASLCSRPSSSLLSTCKPREQSASKYRRTCSPTPTTWSN